MLQLEATRTLEGKADAASKVTLSVFGKVQTGSGASLTEAPQVIYQAQLPASLTTLYTVPSVTTTFISDMTVVNTDSATHTFTLNVGPSTSSVPGTQITPTFTIPSGGMAIYGQDGWTFYDATGHRLNTTT